MSRFFFLSVATFLCTLKLREFPCSVFVCQPGSESFGSEFSRHLTKGLRFLALMSEYSLITSNKKIDFNTFAFSKQQVQSPRLPCFKTIKGCTGTENKPGKE